MNAKLEDGSGSFHGFVRPKWNRRVVYLEKRSCAACNYHRVRSTKSGPHGYFRFVVPAPRSGRWWWRASTPATGRFIWSYSAVSSRPQLRLGKAQAETVQVSVPAISAARSPSPCSSRAAATWPRTWSSYVGRST